MRMVCAWRVDSSCRQSQGDKYDLLHGFKVCWCCVCAPQVGKSSANRASKAPNKKSATVAAEEGSAALSAVYAKGAKAIDDLKKVRGMFHSAAWVSFIDL